MSRRTPLDTAEAGSDRVMLLIRVEDDRADHGALFVRPITRALRPYPPAHAPSSRSASNPVYPSRPNPADPVARSVETARTVRTRAPEVLSVFVKRPVSALPLAPERTGRRSCAAGSSRRSTA